MEYERIHKPQSGMISPSKLRMKLIGPHIGKKKDGSGSNSARTSPSRPDDSEFVKNSLLASDSGDFGEEVSSAKMPNVLGTGQMDPVSTQPKQTLPMGKSDFVHGQMQQFSKGEGGDSSAIHPMRKPEDENLDYDSNASSSSFEFHKERAAGHPQFTRSLSRPMSSKWNDAEKWIMSRQNVPKNQAKKSTVSSQANRGPATNTIRVIHELASYDPKSSVGKVADLKCVDVYQPAPQMMLEKFSFDPSTAHPFPTRGYRGDALIDQCTQIKYLNEVDERCPEEDATALPGIRSVCMRDMGTEMTPATSLEPSRAATPMGATTPLRSPTSSIPSTPRRGGPGGIPMEYCADNSCHHMSENVKRELTEEEMKLKTRSEIVALGVQLGKMNIAAWASKDDQEKQAASAETHALRELERIEYEKRAAIWEEAEKSRHAARYKREEIKIQEWESQQKAKLEAERQKMEARVEEMRTQAQAKMVKKISMAMQKSEEKRAAAESRKSRDAERTAAQAEYIRQTGRMPSSRSLSSHNLCCGWWS